MKNYLLLFLFLWSSSLKAQAIISGKVVSHDAQGIQGVSVTYKSLDEKTILGFAVSKENGEFILKAVSTMDSLQLSFSHISYRKKIIKIANKTANYTFTLEAGANLLKEVVASVPIYKRGDTINYRADVFTSKQDRVIADVIKKLPGIVMNGNQILYQGKPIQRYMVNNLDLMGSKYDMINSNLPADAVKNVQIVENDQPIKILDSLVFSDRATLNIQLKKFTTTGVGNVGGGYKPEMWELNLTPMTFGKNFQFVNSFQSNNSGNDVSSQLKYLSGDNIGRVITVSGAEIQNGASYFGFADVLSPGFDQKKWLDNRIALYSGNVLRKFSSGLEVKGNLSYYNNLVKRSGFSSTSLFSPEQTISYTETINNRYLTNDFNAGITILKNEKNIYLKNNLIVHRRWNNDIGRLLLQEDMSISQKNNYDDYGIINQFSVAKFVGKQLISFNSRVDYGSTPQTFNISPGQFTAIFNNGESFDVLKQQVQFRKFKTDNNASFTRKFNGVTLSPKIGMSYERNQLSSQILTEISGSGQQLDKGFENDLHSALAKFYIDIFTEYQMGKWKFSATTPFSFNNFNLTQFDNTLLNHVTRYSFNPELLINYKLNPKLNLSANGSYGNQFGGLSNFYSAYIVSSYRNIQKYNGRLQESRNLNSGLSLTYQNATKARFANISYNYVQAQRDYIIKNTLDSRGLSTIELDSRNSAQNTHSVSGGVSTYLPDIKTVLKLSSSVNYAKSDFLLNNLLTKQNTVAYSAGFQVNNSSMDILGIVYSTDFNQSISKLGDQYKNTILTNNHSLTLNVNPIENHNVSISNAYYLTNIKNQKNQLFTDLIYRWTLSKLKTDLEFSMTNLFNNDRYIQKFNTEYSVMESYFQLRPRRFMLSTKFKF